VCRFFSVRRKISTFPNGYFFKCLGVVAKNARRDVGLYRSFHSQLDIFKCSRVPLYMYTIYRGMIMIRARIRLGVCLVSGYAHIYTIFCCNCTIAHFSSRLWIWWCLGCGHGPGDCSKRSDWRSPSGCHTCYVGAVVLTVDFAQRNGHVRGWIVGHGDRTRNCKHPVCI